MRHVFLDESSQNAHRFMVLGFVSCPAQMVRQFEHDLDARLAGHGIQNSELKWTKVSGGKLAAYRAAVDFYFDEMVPLGSEAHALIVDTSLLDHRAYNEGDSELGFNKFLFQILYHRAGKPFVRLEKIVVDLDARNTARDLLELQTCLNRRAAKDLGIPQHRPFTRVAHRNSKGSRLIQVADLLTGAIAWHKNAHDTRPEASAAKSALAAHVAGKIGLRRLGGGSSYGEKRLSMWNMQLGPRGGRARQSRP